MVAIKHTIHIHQQKMRAGEPAIIDRTYKGSEHSEELEIICSSCGDVAATVVQSDVPDSCGARVWIKASLTRRP